MKTFRLASIGFILLWLGILTVFSYGSAFANALIIYALLATLVGLRQSHLIRQDGGRSAACALAYAAALNFGYIGGMMVGALSVLGRSLDAGGGMPGRRLLSRCAAGGVSGLATGLLYSYLRSVIGYAELLNQVATLLLPALACLALTAVASLTEIDLSSGRSVWGRLSKNAPLPTEYSIGVVLAIGGQVLCSLYAWEAMLFMVPIIYLARGLMTDFLITSMQTVPKVVRYRLADMYLSTIHSLVAAIDAKDRFTRTHTTNVEKLAVDIARRMGLSAAEIEGLRTAALLHDIGKLGIPDHILLKPGKLDQDEFAKMKHHSEIGQKILDSVEFPWPVGAMIRSHHERWDGTGYPDGLKNEEIPLGARILCVADVYDAMISKRSYRASNTPEEAIKYIRAAAGSHFDPAVVRAFEQVIAAGELSGVDRTMLGKTESRHTGPAQTGTDGSNMGSLVDDISRSSSEFIAMFEIAQTASTSLNLEEVLNLLASKIRNMVSCSTCVIFLRDEDFVHLQAKIAVGVNSHYFEGGRTLVGEGLTGMVAQTGEGLIAEYDRNDVMLRQILAQWVELQSVMIVPITIGGITMGTINLYDMKRSAFSDENFHLLTSVAPQVGRAIQNALLFEETKESALTDMLTGLHNARHLFVRLEQELARAKRSLKPLSVLGMDLDNFKAINDTFGHQRGDEVLKDVAQVFLAQVRSYDLVCRCAGDEFIIVLPGTDKSEALETASRIKLAVDSMPPYTYHGTEIRVGVSIGVATYPEDGQDVHTLIACADEGMYSDKKQRKQGYPAA